MSDRISNIYSYNDNYYRERNPLNSEAAFWLATAASAAIMATLPKFSNPFIRQIKSEHANNHLYKDAFFKSIEKSNLEEEGLKFRNTLLSAYEQRLLGTSAEKSIKNLDVKLGMNAFYSPDTKEVYLNAEKATITGFHELGHAMNHLKSKFGWVLQKMRKPGYYIAGLMGIIALSTRNKPKEAPKTLGDRIKDNCGKIAFIALLPTVAEEALASYKGISLAKEAGLSKELLKNLRKFYGKALLSYIGYAAVTGFSVFATSKIMEAFTRPKKVESPYQYNRNYYIA